MTLRERLAWHMFVRRCELDGAEPGMAQLAWTDQGIENFWLAEADHVLEFAAAEIDSHWDRTYADYKRNGFDAFDSGFLDGLERVQSILRGNA